MAIREGQQVDTLPIQLYGFENGSPSKIEVVDGALKVQVTPDTERGEAGESLVHDTALEEVFGSERIVENGKIPVSTISRDTEFIKKVYGTNAEASVDVSGYGTATIQLSGTWTGTITFEATVDGGNYIAIPAVTLSTNTIAYTTTANNIFRFNIAGLVRIRVRSSAAITGTAIVVFRLSSAPQPIPFAQSTTGIVSTHDDYVPYIAPSQMYETGFELEDGRRVTAPTVNPTQPTSYAANQFARYPQKFRRLRVEIGGSEKLPFAQEQNTNKLLISAPDIYSLLGEILLELKSLNYEKLSPMENK